MTTVTFSQKGSRIIVSAREHATGSPEVCSGISMMLCTLEAWLINNPDNWIFHRGRLDPGDTVIEFVPAKYEVYTILDYIILGLKQLEYSYGKEFVTVKVEETLENTGWVN